MLISLCLSGVSAVFAQDELDPDGTASYGGAPLEAGFLPDPYVMTMLSGGPLDAAALALGSGCAGYINNVPDFRIVWSGQATSLRLFFLSEGDTTLVVRTPTGKYACNDDFDGLNPLVQLTNPDEGSYDIWVGSYEEEYLPGYLMLSEGESSPLNIVSPLIAAAGASLVEPPHDHPEATLVPQTGGDISGVQHFANLSQLHVEGRVNYPQTPPVGGEHAPVWLNCGIYDQPVPNENAVHSMEHGAVWITYDPLLPAGQVETLRALARGGTHRILSPYAGLPGRIVATAWGYQLQLDSADDPRLPLFIAQFEQGPTTPEPGATCAGGVGTPLR
jgi:hypothetical protein